MNAGPTSYPIVKMNKSKNKFLTTGAIWNLPNYPITNPTKSTPTVAPNLKLLIWNLPTKYPKPKVRKIATEGLFSAKLLILCHITPHLPFTYFGFQSRYGISLKVLVLAYQLVHNRLLAS